MNKQEENRLIAKGLTAFLFMMIGFFAGFFTQIH